MLDVGESAPEFELPNQTDETVSRSAFEGDPLVVFFFPRAGTEGCTAEAIGFNDRLADFEAQSISVVGISDDPVTDLEQFSDDHALQFDLLSDENGEVATLYESYGEKLLYGNTFKGVFRNTYVIDSSGDVSGTFEDITPADHAGEVLEWFTDRQSTVTADD